MALPSASARDDRFSEQGAHAHGKSFVPIEDLLLPVDHPDVVAEIKAFDFLLSWSRRKVKEPWNSYAHEAANPRFVKPDEEQARRWPRKPMVAWQCGSTKGSFGCTGYTVAVPAVKVAGDGP